MDAQPHGGHAARHIPGLTFQNEALHVTPQVALLQVRVRKQVCGAFYAWLWGHQSTDGKVPMCYPDWSSEEVDRAGFGPQNSSCALVPGATSHWTGVDLGGDGIARGYLKEYNFRYSYLYTIPTARLDRTVVEEGFDCLQKSGWIDEGTRAILVRLSVAHSPDTYSQFQYLVEIDSRGGYLPTLESLSYTTTGQEKLSFAKLFIRAFAISVFFLRLAWELYEDIRFRSFYTRANRTTGLLKLVFGFWRVYDVVLLSLAVAAFCLEASFSHDLNAYLARLGNNSTDTEVYARYAEWFLLEFQWFQQLRLTRQMDSAVMLLAMLEFLRFLTLSASLKLSLVETIRIAVTPLTFVLAGCFLITISYAFAAFILFGDQVSGYYTVWLSIGNTMLMLVDAYDDYEKLAEVLRTCHVSHLGQLVHFVASMYRPHATSISMCMQSATMREGHVATSRQIQSSLMLPADTTNTVRLGQIQKKYGRSHYVSDPLTQPFVGSS